MRLMSYCATAIIAANTAVIAPTHVTTDNAAEPAAAASTPAAAPINGNTRATRNTPAATTDTAWTDTVFAQAFGQPYRDAQFPYSDVTPKTFDYRVRVESMTEEVGLPLGYVTATAHSAAYFSGIPGARNLQATTDSAGKVRLAWGRPYSGFSGLYLVYRREAGATESGVLVGATTDTLFTDTVFAQAYDQTPKPDQLPFTQTTPAPYEYHVRTFAPPVWEAGVWTEWIQVTVLPPALASSYDVGQGCLVLMATLWGPSQLQGIKAIPTRHRGS
jgi:hypothetical protein